MTVSTEQRGRILITRASLDVGLVNRVSEPGHAVEDAVALAEEICLSAPLSVRAALAALSDQREQDDAAGWDATVKALASIVETEDLHEGVRAFLEKRHSQWAGR